MEDTVIPPRSQLDVSTSTVYDRLRTKDFVEDDTWATQPVEMRNGLLVARVLVPNKSEEIPVRVLNATDKPVHMSKGTEVTELEQVHPLEPQQEVLSKKPQEDMGKIISDLMDRVDDGVPKQVKEELASILLKHTNVFSKGEWDLGWTNLVTHTIDTGDARPFRQPMRRYPPVHLKAIDEHLNDMLQQGVIERAASPWASNVVLAKKKDGSLRCCIDYRQLNELTRKDAYPLPHINDCLDAMSGSVWFSTFASEADFTK